MNQADGLHVARHDGLVEDVGFFSIDLVSPTVAAGRDFTEYPAVTAFGGEQSGGVAVHAGRRQRQLGATVDLPGDFP